MGDATSQIIGALIAGGKWFILLPLRMTVAILNVVPTPAKTYTVMHRTQFDQVTASYKVQTTNPVHLGHFIVAWVRGDFHRTWVSSFKTVRYDDDSGGDSDMIETGKTPIRGIDTERLNAIIEDCKIW